MTPQQRWQAFQKRLPVLTFWQKVALIGGGGVLLLACVIFLLPFLLPLGGLKEMSPEALQDPDGAFIDINGEELYYLHKSGSGEAVIFVHGFGGSSLTWREVLPLLPPTYDAYAVDLIGFGLSAKGLELDHSHQAQADMIAAFMAAHGIQQAHLVGFDMGGNVVLQLAQRHPERVKTLTLVAVAVQTAPTGEIPPKVFEVSFLQRWARVLLRSIMPDATEIQLQSAAENDSIVTPALIEDYQRTYHTPDWDLSLLAIARDSSHSNLAEPLEDLDMPVLLVWGDLDKWIASSTADDLATQIPDAQQVTLAGIGHLPMHEAPLKIAEELVAFWMAH